MPPRDNDLKRFLVQEYTGMVTEAVMKELSARTVFRSIEKIDNIDERVGKLSNDLSHVVKDIDTIKVVIKDINTIKKNIEDIQTTLKRTKRR